MLRSCSFLRGVGMWGESAGAVTYRAERIAELRCSSSNAIEFRRDSRWIFLILLEQVRGEVRC